MAGLGKGCDYFKSLPGLLKIIEFVSLLFPYTPSGKI
jgi:hypothetical protein